MSSRRFCSKSLLDSLDEAMILYEANELESDKIQCNTEENIDGLMKENNEKSEFL